jgi:hypothetical protein
MNVKQKISRNWFAVATAGLLFTVSVNAQVTIGSMEAPTPGAVLDLSKVPSKDLGIMLPQVELTDLSAWAPLAGTPNNGMFVYNTNASTGTGIYYWKDGNWIFLSASTPVANFWSVNGNAGTNRTNNFIGTTDDNPLTFKVNNTLAGYLGGNESGSTGSVNFGWGTSKPDWWANTAIGHQALGNNKGGYGNTAIGWQSLHNDTVGSLNTAVGIEALRDNIGAGDFGHCNVAVGAQTLMSNTFGGNNTAIGYLALGWNKTGSDNIAIGKTALQSNETGGGNVAIGSEALLFGNSSANIAIGQWALRGYAVEGGSISAGNENVGVGWDVMSHADNVSQSVAIGRSAFANAKAAGSQSVAIGFEAGVNDTIGIITAIGWKALNKNTSGSQNTAVGHNALQSNTEGNNNTVVGAEALVANTTGNLNTAIGLKAMFYHQTGDYNTAIGAQALVGKEGTPITGYENAAIGSGALYSNTTGFKNTAVGTSPMWNNESGEQNVAVGNETLGGNIDGSWNTAVGTRAMWSTCNECRIDGFPEPSGHSVANSAFGYEALRMITTGSSNTSIGNQTLHEATTAALNVAVGNNALFNHKHGNANIAIGMDALNRDSVGRFNIAIGYKAVSDKEALRGEHNIVIGHYANLANEDLSNAIAIGSFAVATENNSVVIGNNGVTSIGGVVDWSVLSDARIKKNIRQNVPGLSFINQLKPVTYNLDLDAIDKIQYNGNTPTPSQGNIETRIANQQIVHTGFIAQEVENTAKKLGYDFSGVEIAETEGSLYKLRYAEFVVPLVKAVQELSTQNETKDAAIVSLQNQIDELKIQIELLLASGK